MKINWTNFLPAHEPLIEHWLSDEDKKFLCLTEKTWEQTANDISSCLLYARNGAFRNVIGYINGSPAVALMFGIEMSGKVLRIYNITTNPQFRHKGIATQAIKDILSEDNIFSLNKTYSKITTSIFPDNKLSLKLFTSCGFNELTKNDEYLDLSRPVIKNNEKEQV